MGAPLPGTAPNACSQGGLLQHGASCRVDVHAVCEDLAQANTALLSLAPNTLDFVANSSGMVSVTNDAGSAVAAADVVASIPGGSNISVQSTTCGASLAIGASCTIAFTSAVAEGPTTISVAGGNTLPITLDVTVLPDTAQLSLSPTTLDFEVNGSGMVSVTNDAGSAVAATDVVATIPGGSNISVQSTTCGASLAIGASCTITFTSAVAEGPTAVTVAGSNTPATGVDITVLAAPAISLTAPVQQSRVIPVGGGTLNLLVTNSAASAVNATNLTISNKAACPSVVVDDSDCSSVAPGATCTLALSSNTPYAPCVLTLGGDNTANSPQTLVAFSHLGGLVYAESGGVGKVVIDVAQQFSSVWSSVFTDITTSTSDGSSNTDNIVADGSCFINPGQCAAQQCRNIGADWYLPAQDELQSVHGALCTNSAVPCNFGGFSASAYWTSTASTISNATVVSMPSGVIALATKAGIYPVRCVRTF